MATFVREQSKIQSKMQSKSQSIVQSMVQSTVQSPAFTVTQQDAQNNRGGACTWSIKAKSKTKCNGMRMMTQVNKVDSTTV